jgi:predicted component of viral defense system (DUF524 family)
MIENKQVISVNTEGGVVELTIYGEGGVDSTISRIDKNEALANGEAEHQIIEGNFYEYKIRDGYYLEPSEIVTHSRVNKSAGRISPNIYVGLLAIGIFKSSSAQKCGEVKLEVKSVKTTYRQDYRHMLEEITQKCTDLLLQQSSPVSQNLESDFNTDTKTLYQRFAFINSVIDSEEFTDAVHKILSAPVTKWGETEAVKEIRAVRRINGSIIRQVAGSTNRVDLPEQHALKSILKSVAAKVRVAQKRETVDTPENRFIKYALSSFLEFCSGIIQKASDGSRLKSEALQLEQKLEQYLSHSIFREISRLTTLPLNSPVLQRKEGYREVLRVWLMFDLAAKLVWHGGEDVYSGGKRDVAILYEYWLFFKLLEVVREIFKIEPKSIDDLIKPTADGLGLQLRQGKYLPIQGVCDLGARRLNVEFSYNKTFGGKTEYPKGGSWSRDLRPDYTLSIWPFGIGQHQAELEELIVHIHFDAKYKIENLVDILGDERKVTTDEDIEASLNDEKTEQKKGTYKRADILKMHTYRDAIRRTAGAYVLYPGTESERVKGFHEILPGLGAFAISPSKSGDGTLLLKKFLEEVAQHFLNRTSQREQMSFRTYETHKDKDSNEIREAIPEAYGENRGLQSGKTTVLIGYYKDEAHLKWIIENRLYNARAGNTTGSLRLDTKITNAEYLLLHGRGEVQTGKLYKLKDKGPRIFSQEELVKINYPDSHNPYYLMFDILGEAEDEFKKYSWDIRLLENYSKGKGSALPFAATLIELMKAKVSL